ncbi:heterokaryon incompatibility protein 6, OR allele [Chaetomidium leptoderma]|uniref:Heterokaryon incompatibility protein 6, OR allele n=1 Tax=Chaetomidium leptoderma TaxID=669021 RepID=A0AAN6ZTH1_9PEZI|nr:heterokaryon incompatibility protein 6, OR allele [Chaetomidium leptoderma]
MADTHGIYKPIQLPLETRVLTLSPGEHDDPLIGSLSTLAILSPSEPYEALSYCWNSSVVVISKKYDPDFKISAALYGTDENGNRVESSEKIAFKDMLNHPHYESFYIRMGGQLPDGVLLLDTTPVIIGGELDRALRRLRDTECSLRIWVDALCINQTDISERNEHVKVMSQIYANASHVRLWLGETIGLETELQHTLGTVQTVLEDVLLKDGLFDSGASLRDIQRKFVNSPDAVRIEWGRIAELVDRAWFSRTWVIQEIANARDVTIHIGPVQLPWEYLADTLCLLRTYRLDYPMANSKGLKAIVTMRELRTELVKERLPHTKQDFLRLLEELRGFKSTIPSDKLYGVVGMTAYKAKLAIDYSKPPEQVFTDFAINQLQTGSLDILTHCVDVPTAPQTLPLPSWVPDWTRPGWVEPLRIRGLAANACGTTKPSFHLNRANNTLSIKGRLLDRITALEPARQIPPPPESTGIPVGATQDETLQNMNPAHRHAHRVAQYRQESVQVYTNILHLAFPAGTPPDLRRSHPAIYDRLWRTVMCNRTRDNAVPDPAVGARGFGVHLNVMMSDSSSDVVREMVAAHIAEEGGEGVEVDADAYEQGLREAYQVVLGANSKFCHNRRFCRSERGRLGWVVEGVREGDVVGVFHGGQYPFVLREVEGGWSIVGDCYLDGFMDGEGMEEEFGDCEREFVIV